MRHLARPQVAGPAAVEAHETAGLKPFDPGRDFLAVVPAIALGTVHPEELDRAVLRAEFLELGLLHCRRVASGMVVLVVGELAQGEIQCQVDAVLVARLAEVGQHVAAQRGRVALRSVVFVSQRQKPSWCLVRKRM